MHYLLSVLDHETGTATPEEMTAISAFNERLRDGDHLVFLGGLAAPAATIVVDHRGEHGTAHDESPAAGGEYVSGLWLIRADSYAQALALAGDASRACARRVELRQFLDV